MARIVNVVFLNRNRVFKKIQRKYGLMPDAMERIGRCSCGEDLFCVRIFTGCVDSQCKNVHICSGLNCSFIKEHNSLSLRPEDQDFQCPLCQEKKQSDGASAILGRRRTQNYSKFI